MGKENMQNKELLSSLVVWESYNEDGASEMVAMTGMASDAHSLKNLL